MDMVSESIKVATFEEAMNAVAEYEERNVTKFVVQKSRRYGSFYYLSRGLLLVLFK